MDEAYERYLACFSVNSKLDNVLKAGSLLGSDLGNDDLENVIVSLACETSEVARKNMGEVTACYREGLCFGRDRYQLQRM